MKTPLILLAASLLTLGNGRAQNLLPKPQHVVVGKGKFHCTGIQWAGQSDIGTGATLLLHDILPQDSGSGAGRHTVLLGKLDANNAPEAYTLCVTPDSIVLNAATQEGYLRGLQTLRQMRAADGTIACCTISDAPAYGYRGAMIDVSRHFFPISFLKKQIDVLSYYKMNRLHLHLTDAAGWRMEIKRYPRLTTMAAWRNVASWKTWWNGGRQYAEEGSPEAHGGYYTQDELRDLVRYAAERGITIIPEIEMPAHSEEVLTAYPELSCTHEPYKQADFCPGSVATYDFLENVLREVMAVFPSRYIHVGGDEAGKASWPTCPLCQKKMAELGIDDVKGLQSHLIARMGNFLNENGRQLIGWDEVIDGNLAKGTTVMVWRSADFAKDAVKNGYDVILSPGSHCYLDFYQDAPPTQPEAIGGYLTLERVYSFVPGEGLEADEREKHVRGVQGNLWTEYIPTPEHAEYMLYPRILALAEIGWNGTEKKDFAEFRKRATAETDRLRAAGVNAFNLRKEVGNRPQSTHITKHKALGAAVTYNKPYSAAYPGAGNGTLTDGISGGWSNTDGRWQGFIGKDCFDITIDLGKRTAISEVSTTFMQVCGPEIYFPATYTVSVSDNGTDFAEIGQSHEPAVKTDLPDVKTRTIKKKASARYVRVRASAGEFGGWIFADEVVVR